MADDDFKWGPDNEDVAVPSQSAIAVYENVNGQIAIRRERSWNDDEDIVIVVDKQHVGALIAALQKVADLKK